MHFLLTNDDGIQSEGLWALAAALKPHGEVTVVAPLSEASATSQSITLARPLRILPYRNPLGIEAHAVDGTPADCVKLGLLRIVPRATCVVAGINRGANVGGGVFYSGTVAAAREGRLAGREAAAVSLHVIPGETPDFRPAASHAALVLARLLRGGGERVVWNLNYPARLVRTEVCVVPQDGNGLRERYDDAPGAGFVLEGTWEERPPEARTDLAMIRSGRISLTPLTVDWTDRVALDAASEILFAPGRREDA
ncbi:MAG: 5'/3'-nucleotidase SurE [Planctomycetes bacterium]|nr:5'/3'-nucleotidase SurE [Planctomycetota bacterium]